MARNGLKFQRIDTELRQRKRAEWNRPLLLPLLLAGDTQAAMLKLHSSDKPKDAKKGEKVEKPADAVKEKPAPAPQPAADEAEPQSGWKALLGKFKLGEK